MSQVAVREVQASSKKFKCGTCDAPIEFDPASGALKCPYCGSEKAIEAGPGAVVEHALHEASLAKHRGYGVAVRKLACDACGAQISFDPGVVAAKCCFCGSPKVAETSGEGIRPESLLPFTITPAQSSELFNHWIRGLWFRPNDLKKLAEVKEVRGVYLPFWTYDAHARSWWTAEAGYHYYVTETYTANENGRSVTRTRQVRKTRWERASGSRADHYDDELVYASKGLPKGLVEDIYPYDTGKLLPYTPEYLAGWGAEEAGFGAEHGWAVCQQSLNDQQRGKCAKDVPGDTHRNLSVSTSYSGVTFKHALLPAYVAAYAYKGKVFRFLVNGQTGKTDGEAPLSWVKIALAVLAVLAIVGAIVLIASAQDGGSGRSSGSGTSAPVSAPAKPARRR